MFKRVQYSEFKHSVFSLAPLRGRQYGDSSVVLSQSYVFKLGNI